MQRIHDERRGHRTSGDLGDQPLAAGREDFAPSEAKAVAVYPVEQRSAQRSSRAGAGTTPGSPTRSSSRSKQTVRSAGDPRVAAPSATSPSSASDAPIRSARSVTRLAPTGSASGSPLTGSPPRLSSPSSCASGIRSLGLSPRRVQVRTSSPRRYRATRTSTRTRSDCSPSARGGPRLPCAGNAVGLSNRLRSPSPRRTRYPTARS